MSTSSFPAHWTVGSFRHFAGFTTGWTPPTDDADAYDGPHLWANISDLGPTWISETRKHLSADEVKGASPCNVGDLLFAFKLSVGRVSRAARPMFTNEAIATIPASPWLDPAYGFYALPEFLPRAASLNIYGAPLLNAGLIRRAQVALPPIDEQREIAGFLDRETTRIDTLIEEQERLIELLRERRRSSVERSVSTLSWETPLRAASDLIQTGPFGSQLKSDEYETGGVPVINPSHLANSRIQPDPNVAVGATKAAELVRHKLRAGDIIAARRGELGRCAVATEADAGFLCGTGSVLIRPDVHVALPDFVALVFGTQRNRDALSLASVGSTMNNLNANIVGSLRIPMPPEPEQRYIVSRVRAEVSKVDRLVTESERFIGLARERRAALITAAVTGQIDVRDPETLETG